MGAGSWTLRVHPETPRRVLDRIDWAFTPAAAFGHVLVFSTRVDAAALSTTDMLKAARYVGVLLEWRDALTIGGEGPAWWLGDSSGKGDVLTTAITRTAGSLTQWIGDIRPSSLNAGTVTDPGGTVTGSYQWVTRRQALEAVCDAFGVEWRVTPELKLDVGVATALWSSTPTAVVIPRFEGRDGPLRSLDAGGVERSQDLREYANAAYVLGPAGVSTSSAASGLSDINGNAVTRGVVVQASAAAPGTESTVAAAERTLRQQTRRHVKLSSKTHDIAGDIATGGHAWVFDPQLGLFDAANEVIIAGQVIKPLKMRAMAQTWPIREGMGVWFRDGAGNLTDLTDWYVPDRGDATVEFGAIARTLGNTTGIVGTTDSGELQAQIGLVGWQSWTPALTASTTNPTLGSGSEQKGRWRRVENLVIATAKIKFGTSGTNPGSGTYSVSLPVPAAVSGSDGGAIGYGWIGDASVGDLRTCVYRPFFANSKAEVYFTGVASNAVTNAVPWTWAANDELWATFVYEGAF